MNKTAIKNFSIWARNKLIADISYRAGLLGITPAGIRSPLPQSTGTTQFFDIGSADPYVISGEQIKQRTRLAEALRSREQRSDYATAYKYLMEEVAYTWFNRLAAIRFMEVNDYLPGHIRVLSSDSGKIEPDLCTTPFEAGLDFTADEERLIVSLKNENRLDDLFRLLFVKQCNALNSILPSLFERTDDYTELLLNLSVIDQDGVVWHLVHDIPEDDFNVEKGGQVEIIGWLYQYYNTEPKSAAFAKTGKITKEEIPAVTQLFTPDWIVRYMVENSLGRLWVEGHPNDDLKTEWKYYLEEAEQEAAVQAQLRAIRSEYAKLNPEDIHLIDPCMGSGHILVYAFDVLMQIYETAGYARRDAVRSILENNLFGLDIDKRAYQLAYFALMMKARQYDKRFLSRGIAPHVFAIEESNSVNRAQLRYFGTRLDELSRNNAENQLQDLLDTFVDAKEYGSILKVPEMDWNLLREYVTDYDVGDQMSLDVMDIETTQAKLKVLIDQAEVMARKYSVVTTNPPYMGGSNMNPNLTTYVKKYYSGWNKDIYACFMNQGLNMLSQNGFMSFMTSYTWMFLTTFSEVRKGVLGCSVIQSLIQPEYHSFFAEAFVPICAFVVRKSKLDYKAGFIRLEDFYGAEIQEAKYLEALEDTEKCEYYYEQANSVFYIIPDCPIAYWLSESVLRAFSDGKFVGNVAEPRQGLATADNDRFLRIWQEVNINRVGLGFADSISAKKSGKRWFPYCKGGSYRKWAGNTEYIINWENDGYELKNFKGSVIRNPSYYFKTGLTWGSLTVSDISFRYVTPGFLFDSKGPVCFAKERSNEAYLLALLNSKVAMLFLSVLAPTMDYSQGPVSKIPYFESNNASIRELAKNNIIISKSDWDTFETSWDFKRHPLLPPRGEVSVDE